MEGKSRPNAWQLYDDLIAPIPEDLTVTYCECGHHWTIVTSNEGGVGLAMTTPVFSKPYVATQGIVGQSLKKVALLAKSWNFIEAGIGVAAINSYFNEPERAATCGVMHQGYGEEKRDAFLLYQDEVKGKKVAVIGHFPLLEKRFGSIAELSILERNPQWDDFPDSACEYILPEQDYIFITGCTLVNKTLPRLLALGAGKRIVMVGPSTTVSPVLFKHGIYGLSGYLVDDAERCQNVLREGNTMKIFGLGNMIDVVNPTAVVQMEEA